MAEVEKSLFRELRVSNVPENIHLRVERWMEIHNGKTGDGLNKQESVVRLLDKATKHIKLPTRTA